LVDKIRDQERELISILFQLDLQEAEKRFGYMGNKILYSQLA
jgi:hypothetical protein